MRGVLKDCFEISGRGTVVLLDPEGEDGRLLIGDRVSIAGRRWMVAGIEMPNYRQLPPPDVRRLLGVLLTDATKAELVPLIGQTFETLKAQA